MSASLKGIWDNVTLYCLNHEEPQEMTIFSNDDCTKVYYACSTYEETKCPNRLNLDDYQGIVMKVLEKIEDDGIFNNYANYSFSYKGGRQKTFVKILKHTNREVRIGIWNETVLGKKKS